MGGDNEKGDIVTDRLTQSATDENGGQTLKVISLPSVRYITHLGFSGDRMGDETLSSNQPYFRSNIRYD